MGRVLVDASTLIALARIGELELLTELVGRVHVTPQVATECLVEGQPAVKTLEAFLKGPSAAVIKESDVPTADELGLGPGESSLFTAHQPGDSLVLDERNARALALARGIRHTGLLGLLVQGVEEGLLAASRGIEILEKLARGDFRMTVELYDWARGRMRAAAESE